MYRGVTQSCWEHSGGRLETVEEASKDGLLEGTSGKTETSPAGLGHEALGRQTEESYASPRFPTGSEKGRVCAEVLTEFPF